ncbi:desiccation protectant protein Lea14 homolog [Vitis riparia]|uniref:desiccation protectant protein Lea14 homolog n=1 Tax=Vitis riparia TaxID=96939 RepID=UPI00155B3C09|nr:desiccation protectant protein Lea14 homolog [Vitis riparia]
MDAAGARVFDVVIRDKSEERVTYNAKVSMTNPYFTPIRVYNVSYTLKTDNSNRVIVVGRMEELQVLLPASKNIVVEVPILVPHSQLMADIGGAWNSIYQLDLTVTVDLPLSAGQTIPLAWEGEINMPL